MATAATRKKPKLVSLRVAYTVGVKARIADFENSDVRLTRDETWDVSGLTTAQAMAFESERYDDMRTDLGARIEIEYAELQGDDPA